jgi:hypothetical protein
MAYISSYGHYYSTHGYEDLQGRPVSKTKSSHPYSYDAFVTHRLGDNHEINNTIYSDRLLQWDYDKTRKLMKKHFGNDGDYYHSRKPHEIENFLSDWLNKDVKLIVVMEGCNVSNGYPYWVFLINSPAN